MFMFRIKYDTLCGDRRSRVRLNRACQARVAAAAAFEQGDGLLKARIAAPDRLAHFPRSRNHGRIC